jgi:hypothetical protein
MSTITSTSMLRGLELLRNPHFNRGTAFTAEERAALPRGRERLWLWASRWSAMESGSRSRC